MLVPTRRLLVIALSGVVIIGLVGSVYAALFIAGLWLIGVAILAILDGWSVPPGSQLTWTRQHDTKLSLGAWNPVTVTLLTGARTQVIFQVRDGVPPSLIAEHEAGEGTCAPGQSWQMSYRVFPLHRGDYRFGPVTARYLGPLGLVWRQRAVQLDDQIKVYPNLLAIRSYETSARRGQLQELGLRTSRRWGAGTEFERLRDYNPDDESRRINWKATARRHKLVAVEYETERSQTIMLLLDAGRLMATRVPVPSGLGSSPLALPQPEEPPSLGLPRRGVSHTPWGLRPQYRLTRLDYAINAALLLAFVSQQRGDRVGLLAFSDRVQRSLAPRPGRRQFLALTEALYNLEAESTESDYAEATNYLATHNPRRSLLVLFTDIADRDAASTLVTHLGHLARRHLPLVVTLRDPGIESLASARLQNPASVYQRAVARTVLDEREETLVHLRQAGVLTLDVPADQLSPSLINRYLSIKARTEL